MPEAEKSRCRLCLVTPLGVDPADPNVLQRMAEGLVPIAAARGVATLIHNDTRIVGRTGADGVHIDSGAADLAEAAAALRRKKIVGAGGVRSRHEAMLAGESDPDYVFF